MAGQIVIMNGTSGAGKSTACSLLAKRSDDFWLQFGIDHLMANIYPPKYGHHGPHAREGIFAEPLNDSDPDGALRWRFGENGTRAFAIFHEWIAAASREGANIVVDHLMMTGPPVLEDCIWRLEGLPVLLVSLKPPYDVLSQRVASRPMDDK